MRSQSLLALVLPAIILGTVFAPKAAMADYYSCPKMVYDKGWLRKYEYKGMSWAADTKKSGVTSSSFHVSVEDTTSSVDPGVTTGKSVSSTQYSSSWGECAMIDVLIAKRYRDDYIDQNLHEIKKQVALGSGYHVDSLAFLSGCDVKAGAAWSEALQKHTGELYDAKTGVSFRTKLDDVIDASPELKADCHPPRA